MNRGLEGESYIVTPSPLPVDSTAVWIFVCILAVSLAIPMGAFTVGYWAGHNAATAAIHKESS